jgi:hypothetical protein
VPFSAASKIYREYLIAASFVASARKAVAEVNVWFDEDMPKSTEYKINAIERNPLYQKVGGKALDVEAVST